MHVRLIGGADDVTGFALAGVETQDCRSRAEVVQALDAARRDPGVAVVVLSHGAAALVEDLVAGLVETTRPPLILVLPARAAIDAGERTAT